MKKFYIRINGELMEVDYKVYREYYYGKRKEMSGMYTSDKKAYRRRNKIDDKPLKQNRRASEGDSQNGGE